jgi:hypothetical protein
MSISKFSLCSKILYDNHILEQQHEIESLKLKIFWLENDIKYLKYTMKQFNESITKCQCIYCRSFDRCENSSFAWVIQNNTSECNFKEPFEKFLIENSLIFLNEKGKIINKISNYVCTDIDAHINNADGHWGFIQIGRRLWSASSIKNDELIKFHNAMIKMEFSNV